MLFIIYCFVLEGYYISKRFYEQKDADTSFKIII